MINYVSMLYQNMPMSASRCVSRKSGRNVSYISQNLFKFEVKRERGLPMTPENLLHHLPAQKCTLGCPILDGLLAGGIPCNSVTEIVSESGCGKTQLCLQLLLSAQLPPSLGGLSASSLYLHSELPFPHRRLHHLSTTLSSLPNPLDNVFVRPVHSADDLLSLLRRLDSLLLLSHPPPSNLPIKLIVIDSIAVLFRSEFDNSAAELKRRSNLFFRIAGMLKLQAKRFGLAVVVTNQVVDLVESSSGGESVRVGNLGEMWSSGRRVGAALGMAWASCVNSRLFLSRYDEVVVGRSCEGDLGEGEYKVRTRRRIHVVFAPHLPESSCEFEILREGVFGVRS